MISWWAVTVASPTLNARAGEERQHGARLGRVDLLRRRRCTATSRATVTTSETLTGASPRPRATNRAMNQPIAGATTKSTSTRASQVGIPCRTLKSQNTKASSMPNAPWAMLKTRVVL